MAWKNKEKRKEYQKKWLNEHPSYMKDYNSKYRKNCRDKCLKACKKINESNRVGGVMRHRNVQQVGYIHEAVAGAFYCNKYGDIFAESAGGPVDFVVPGLGRVDVTRCVFTDKKKNKAALGTRKRRNLLANKVDVIAHVALSFDGNKLTAEIIETRRSDLEATPNVPAIYRPELVA